MSVLQSSPGRARTCDKRINSRLSDVTFTNEKPKSNDLAKSWVSTGDSEFSCTELQEWIESCPVELEDWQYKAIEALLKCNGLSSKEASANSESGEPTEPDRRVIKLRT